MVTENFDELQRLFDDLEAGPQDRRDASLYCACDYDALGHH